MAKFEEELLVKASPEKIYNLITQSTKIAKLLADVDVRIVEKDDEHDYQITDWHITTDKEDFKWQQRENFDPELLTVHYSMIEGDWEALDARWKIHEVGEESEILFQVEVNPKYEGIKTYLAWPFFRKKMRSFCKEVVQAVKDRLELSYGQSL